MLSRTSVKFQDRALSLQQWIVNRPRCIMHVISIISYDNVNPAVRRDMSLIPPFFFLFNYVHARRWRRLWIFLQLCTPRIIIKIRAQRMIFREGMKRLRVFYAETRLKYFPGARVSRKCSVCVKRYVDALQLSVYTRARWKRSEGAPGIPPEIEMASVDIIGRAVNTVVLRKNFFIFIWAMYKKIFRQKNIMKMKMEIVCFFRCCLIIIAVNVEWRSFRQAEVGFDYASTPENNRTFTSLPATTQQKISMPKKYVSRNSTRKQLVRLYLLFSSSCYFILIG